MKNGNNRIKGLPAQEELHGREIETILRTSGLEADCASRFEAKMKCGKRKKCTTDEMPEEPSIEVRQACAMLYIEKMRKKNIEPAVEDIVNKYLISEEMARAALSQEQVNELQVPD